jgi:hypothetical protein
LIARAVREGELPAHTDVQGAFLGLSALFFGVPMILCRIDPMAVGPAYRAQLHTYWEGLKATPPSRKTARASRLKRPAQNKKR